MHKNYTFIVNLIGNKIINSMLKIIPTKKNTNKFQYSESRFKYMFNVKINCLVNLE